MQRDNSAQPESRQPPDATRGQLKGCTLFLVFRAPKSPSPNKTSIRRHRARIRAPRQYELERYSSVALTPFKDRNSTRVHPGPARLSSELLWPMMPNSPFCPAVALSTSLSPLAAAPWHTRLTDKVHVRRPRRQALRPDVASEMVELSYQGLMANCPTCLLSHLGTTPPPRANDCRYETQRCVLSPI